MENKSFSPRVEAELEEARKALDELLGSNSQVSPEEFIRGFTDAEKLAGISAPGVSAEEVIKTLSSEEKPAVGNLTSASVAMKAVNAFWKWSRSGFGRVSAEVAERRLAACKACENYSDPPDTVLHKLGGMATLGTKAANPGKVCGLCGCYISKKIIPSSEKCPMEDPARPGLSKWGEVIG